MGIDILHFVSTQTAQTTQSSLKEGVVSEVSEVSEDTKIKNKSDEK